MRAAILRAYGAVPEIGEWPAPDGELLGRVRAAGLNPVDVRIASGNFYAGSPEVPYVPGGEGVAELSDGRRVYFTAGGALAEQVALWEGGVSEVPEAVPDGVAVACGTAGTTAWAALDRARLSEGERVLVLGASGAVGAIAVQLARLRGAGEVIGAARSGDWVALEEIEAHGPFDIVIDPLWGEPAEAAARTLAAGGRLVQLGESAGVAARFESSLVRGRQIEIIGLALARMAPVERMAAYGHVLAHAAAGELAVACEELPMDQISEAWERQAGGSPRAKLVLVP